MITLNFDWAVALFLTLSLGIVFILWMFYTLKKTAEPAATHQEPGNINQCPYCTFIFYSYNDFETLRCPRCQSFIEKSR